MRDLHTLFWIAKYVYRVRDGNEPARARRVRPEGILTFRRCEDFLWSVRCNIHFYSQAAPKSAWGSISSARSRSASATPNIPAADVERFMKHYFLSAKDVGNLTAILSAHLEDEQAKPAPVLTASMAKLKPKGRAAAAESDDFLVDNNRITIAAPDVFRTDPVNLIRLFRSGAEALCWPAASRRDALRQAPSLSLINQKLRDDHGSQRSCSSKSSFPGTTPTRSCAA